MIASFALIVGTALALPVQNDASPLHNSHVELSTPTAPGAHLPLIATAHHGDGAKAYTQDLESTPLSFKSASLFSPAELNSTADEPRQSNLKDSYQCAQGQISLYNFERLPLTPGGYGCIGGGGGSRFQWHAYGSMVRSIVCYRNGDNIEGLRVMFFGDSTQYSAGSTHGGSYTSFEFRAGEKLNGDVVLTGNGHGSRLGSIKFQTSEGRTFMCGNDNHDKYLFPSEDSYFSGFFGNSGGEIDHLGLTMWKPIEKAELLSVTYDTNKGNPIVEPSEVWNKVYCNDLPTDQVSIAKTETISTTSGYDSCFTLEETLSISETITVSASIPEVVTVEEETTIEMGLTATQELCVHETKTTTDEQVFGPYTLEAGTSKELIVSQTKETVSALPFTAVLEISFVDNTTPYRETVYGTFEGVQVTDTREVWTNYRKVGPGECQAAEPSVRLQTAQDTRSNMGSSQQ